MLLGHMAEEDSGASWAGTSILSTQMAGKVQPNASGQARQCLPHMHLIPCLPHMHLILVFADGPALAGAHRVTHMLLTSSQGPHRSGSAQSQATFAAPDPLSARSAQASVNHAPAQQPHLDFITPRDQPTPDSGAALPPPLSAHSAAPAPAPVAAAQVAAAPAPEPQPQSSSGSQPRASTGSQPRVPPLLLASILSGGSSASASRGTAPPAEPPTQAQAVPQDEASSPRLADSLAAEAGGSPAADGAAGIPAQQAQSICAELDFLLLAEEFAAATQAQEEAEHEEEEHEEEREEEEEEVQQDEQDKPAEVQGGAASQATAAVPASQGTNHLGASPAAPLMLLPAQRCSAVAATLSSCSCLQSR